MGVIGAVSTTVTPIENEIPFKKLNDGNLLVTPPEESKVVAGFDLNKDKSSVSITVVGASGDLAKKKIFPALFALYYEDCLPEVLDYNFLSTLSLFFETISFLHFESACFVTHSYLWMQHFTIFGYARSKMTDAELRDMVSRTLTCRIDKR